MTAEREAMTLERQAFDKWVASKPDDWFDEASAEAIAWIAWQTRADLSRAAEPVGEVIDVAGTLGEMRVIRWRAGYAPPVGTKLFAHPSEDGRHRRKLQAVIRWLESNQPDVFRRGLWDAIGESNGD